MLTDAPWTADPIYYGDSTKICAARLFRADFGGSFATIENKSVTGERLPNAEFMTDVRMLAAAPDLYDALSLLLDRLDYHGSIDPIREEGPIEDARMAIAKAKGRTE